VPDREAAGGETGTDEVRDALLVLDQQDLHGECVVVESAEAMAFPGALGAT
jgi:hypothetical protein